MFNINRLQDMMARWGQVNLSPWEIGPIYAIGTHENVYRFEQWFKAKFPPAEDAMIAAANKLADLLTEEPTQ